MWKQSIVTLGLKEKCQSQVQTNVHKHTHTHTFNTKWHLVLNVKISGMGKGIPSPYKQ